jgi:hypothetical protein
LVAVAAASLWLALHRRRIVDGAAPVDRVGLRFVLASVLVIGISISPFVAYDARSLGYAIVTMVASLALVLWCCASAVPWPWTQRGLALVVLAATAALASFVTVDDLHGWQYPAYVTATAALTVLAPTVLVLGLSIATSAWRNTARIVLLLAVGSVMLQICDAWGRVLDVSLGVPLPSILTPAGGALPLILLSAIILPLSVQRISRQQSRATP